VKGSWRKNPRRVGSSSEPANLPAEENSETQQPASLRAGRSQGYERRTPEAAAIAGRGNTLEGKKIQEGIGASSGLAIHSLAARTLAGSNTLKTIGRTEDEAETERAF
jgi:hypothetical protein